MKVRGFGKSVIGDREKNQDAYLVSNEQQLYVVADGVGGGLRGEVAAKMAVEGMRLVEPGEGQLRNAVLRIQEQVLKEAMESIGEAWMGTTMTAVRVLESGAELCHVGDSRCYVYSGEVLKLMTEDHEIFDEALEAPVLASYLGLSPDIQPLKIQDERFAIIPGDRILLCSDGLYKQLSEGRIVELIQIYFSEPERILDTLCEEASKSDFSDNITVVYIEIEQ